MSKPITPKQAAAGKIASLPDDIFDVFNEMIQEKFDGHSAVVKQDAVAASIARRLNLSRQEVFDRHYLDVEEAYENAGWEVVYDKPAYNEDYPATFTFRKKGKR